MSLDFFVKVKDGNYISGKGRVTCPLYEEIDQILGTRAASSPPVVLDSGERHGVNEVNEASPSVESDSGTSFSVSYFT